MSKHESMSAAAAIPPVDQENLPLNIDANAPSENNTEATVDGMQDQKMRANMLVGAKKFASEIDQLKEIKSLNPLARYNKAMDLMYGRHVEELKGLGAKEYAKKLAEQNDERGELIGDVLKLEWQEAGQKAKAVLKGIAQGIGWGLRQTLGLIPKAIKGVAKLAEWGAKGTAVAGAVGTAVATSPVWMTVGAVETASMVVRNQWNPGKDSKSNIPFAGKFIDAAAAKVNGGVDGVFKKGAELVRRLANGLESAQLEERRAKQRAIESQLELPLAGGEGIKSEVKELLNDQKAAEAIMAQAPDEKLRDLEEGEYGPETLEQHTAETLNEAGRKWAVVDNLFLKLKRFDQSADPAMFEHLSGQFQDLTGEEYSPEFNLTEWAHEMIAEDLGEGVEVTPEYIQAAMDAHDDELEDEEAYPGHKERLAEEMQLLGEKEADMEVYDSAADEAVSKAAREQADAEELASREKARVAARKLAEDMLAQQNAQQPPTSKAA